MLFVLVVLAAVDLVAGGWLLWRAPRSRRNREAVVTVGGVLLGCGGFLAVLAVT